MLRGALDAFDGAAMKKIELTIEIDGTPVTVEWSPARGLRGPEWALPEDLEKAADECMRAWIRLENAEFNEKLRSVVRRNIFGAQKKAGES